MIYNDFKTRERFAWSACDTETYTYIDGVIVSEEQLQELGKQHGAAWFREHATVNAYAWIVSCGQKNAICETFDEFIDFVSLHGIKMCWWYNAKFDFAQIDYNILSEKYELYSNYGKQEQRNMFSSLHNEFGARYALEIWHNYEDKAHKRRLSHVQNYDLCNIFGGGLRRILEDLKIKDAKGNDVRKLEMDYQNNKDENGKFTQQSIQYMLNDGIGLYYAIKAINAFMFEKWQYQIVDCQKPSFITAGGFAKTLMLDYLYHKETHKENIKAFQADYKNFIELDKLFRFGGLYRGGICIVNEHYKNEMHFMQFNRYDVNSHYPARMHEGVALKTPLYKFTVEEFEKLVYNGNSKNFVFIFKIKSMRGTLKEDKIPIFYDINTRDYVADIVVEDMDYFIFQEEFAELFEWYDIIYELDCVYAFKKQIDKGYIDFVDDMIALKNQGKKEHNKTMQYFGKLGANNAYGKLAERPDKIVSHREISEETGAVVLKLDDVEIDEKSLLAVWQAAYITSRGRVVLMQNIRKACNEDVWNNFLYCDTDSIHIIGELDDADDFILGKFKLEAACNCGKWLAPKTYFEIDNENFIEIHCKGVPVQVVYDEMLRKHAIEKIQIGNDVKYKVLLHHTINEIFSRGVKFQCLTSMNIKGGKALIPLQKELCKFDNANITFKSNSDEDEELNSVEYDIEKTDEKIKDVMKQ